MNLKLPKEVAGEGDSGKPGDGKVAAALCEALRQAQSRKDELLAEQAKPISSTAAMLDETARLQKATE